MRLRLRPNCSFIKRDDCLNNVLQFKYEFNQIYIEACRSTNIGLHTIAAIYNVPEHKDITLHCPRIEGYDSTLSPNSHPIKKQRLMSHEADGSSQTWPTN